MHEIHPLRPNAGSMNFLPSATDLYIPNRSGVRGVSASVEIQQPDGFYHFSEDSLLLAQFVTLEPGERVLDLGTGVGVVPLLLAARYPQCSFVGVEIQPELAAYAERNSALNSLGSRFTVLVGDYRQLFWEPRFSVVTANPPYFKVGSGRPSSNPSRWRARFEVDATLAETIGTAAKALLNGGRFYLVHRYERLGEIKDLCTAVGLEPGVFQEIDCSRTLVKARKV